MSPEEHQTAWRRLHWPVDEIFMAWHYSRYVNAVVEAGKKEYDIPMSVNAWLQQPNMAWPGTYPSGGPVPQVHDIWRAGGPAIDMLTPDIYIPQFEEAAQRYSRNGNPLFVPETSANPANAFLAFTKFNAIGFSPFGIERFASADSPLARAYGVLGSLAPAIAAAQGKDTMAFVRLNPGDAPQKVTLGGYTIELSYLGQRRAPIAPPPEGVVAPGNAPGAAPGSAPAGTPQPPTPPPAQQAPTPGGAGPGGPGPATGLIGGGRGGQATSTEALVVVIASGPDEFYFGGTSGVRIAMTPGTPGPPVVGIGDVQVGRFEKGKWTVVRQLGGDDTGQGEILSLRPYDAMRVTVYRYR
jgi:hypothetical protein